MMNLNRYYDYLQDSSTCDWKISVKSTNVRQEKLNIRRNRFLKFMYLKIKKTTEIDPVKGWKIFDRFSRSSRCWVIFILNKTEKNYFLKYSKEELRTILSKFLFKNRLKKFKLEIDRIYVEKKDGSLRPIGSPSPDSKMVYASVNEFLKIWLNPQLGEFQHGFRRGRGTFTASMEVIRNLRLKKKVYEFDLRGFFNNLNAEVICREMKKSIPDLADWIRFANRFTAPKIKQLKEKDKEIRFLSSQDGVERWIKSGFTQGANWSPIICLYSLIIAKYEQIKGLLMYADDGLIFRDQEEEITNLNNRKWGIMVNEDKNLGWTTKFKFLGITYNSTDMTAEFDGVKVSVWDDDKITTLLKYSKYTEGKSPGSNVIHYGKEWAWKCKDNSLITNLNIWEGNRPIVAETGTFFCNELYTRTDANILTFSILSELALWKQPQRSKIRPSYLDNLEGNKLFNINVKIGKNVTLQQTTG